MNKRRKRDPWNRYDDCGRFIPMNHFDLGFATRVMVTPDTAFTSETYETLCCRHSKPSTTRGTITAAAGELTPEPAK
jgi:hypothetical protein